MSSKQQKQITSVANLIAESKAYLREIGQIKSGTIPFGIVIKISDLNGEKFETIIYRI